MFYAWGTATADSLDAIAKFAKKSDSVNIHVDNLREAFRNGIDEWAVDVERDPTRTAKVVKRSSEWLTNLPKETVDEALKAIPNE